MTDPLRGALDELVPAWDGAGDWGAVVRGAREAARRRRIGVAALAAALLVPLVATPAFGLRHALLGWVGRLDVPFHSSRQAPLVVRKEFHDLDFGAPPRWANHPLADSTRDVGPVAPGSHLYVGATKGGGFCWQFSGAGGLTGCLPRHPSGRRPIQSSWSEVRGESMGAAISTASGFVVGRNASRLRADYADGAHRDVPFVYVSAPIDAGFFLYRVPKAALTPARRLTALVLLGPNGRELGRQTFHYPTRADLRRDAAARAALRAQMRHPSHYEPGFLAAASTVAPTAPLQRGRADGVSVVAGRNGVVLFDLRDATARVRALLGRAPSLGCIRFRSFHGLRDDHEQLFGGRVHGTVAVRIFGEAPFDACELRGTYGHTWPDRNGGHSAVELAFDAAAGRYFTDRAAARDLALFVHSRRTHALRKLTGPRLVAGLAAAYGDRIDRGTPSTSGRIGYVLEPGGVTFVERSPTGRRFHVTIRHRRIAAQNLKPFAFPF